MAKSKLVQVKILGPDKVEKNRRRRAWRMSLKKGGGHHLYVSLQPEASAAMKCILLVTKESKKGLIERLIAQEAQRRGPFRFEQE